MRGGNHSSLAVGLALGTALTVFIISYGYTRIIEHFPSGGGGYVVATKLLGARFGVVSGSALLVDYVLTITVSIASGGDQVFNLIPRSWFGQTEVFNDQRRSSSGTRCVRAACLTSRRPGRGSPAMNICGVKESVQPSCPSSSRSSATHPSASVATLATIHDIGAVAHETTANFHDTLTSLTAFGTLALFVRAYSLGGGTYTGIEAVSNGIQIMREPKVRTAKRTMMLMATSLAITAGGIILCVSPRRVRGRPRIRRAR